VLKYHERSLTNLWYFRN